MPRAGWPRPSSSAGLADRWERTAAAALAALRSAGPPGSLRGVGRRGQARTLDGEQVVPVAAGDLQGGFAQQPPEPRDRRLLPMASVPNGGDGVRWRRVGRVEQAQAIALGVRYGESPWDQRRHVGT